MASETDRVTDSNLHAFHNTRGEFTGLTWEDLDGEFIEGTPQDRTVNPGRSPGWNVAK